MYHYLGVYGLVVLMPISHSSLKTVHPRWLSQSISELGLFSVEAISKSSLVGNHGLSLRKLEMSTLHYRSSKDPFYIMHAGT